jgi:hypothetical protein
MSVSPARVSRQIGQSSCPFDSETRTLVTFEESDEPDEGGGETDSASTADGDIRGVGAKATGVAGLVVD